METDKNDPNQRDSALPSEGDRNAVSDQENAEEHDAAPGASAADSDADASETFPAERIDRFPERKAAAEPEVLEGAIVDLKTLHQQESGGPSLAQFGSVRPYVLAGIIIAIALFGSLTVWSVTAPLARGAIAPGSISVASNRKSIQHLEGGIVRDIKVDEGDKVEKGDILMVLDSSRATANLSIQERRLLVNKAQLARLQAQNQGEDAVEFPEEVLKAAERDPEMAALIETQLETFESQRTTMRVRKEILEEQVAQFKEQIEGFRSQIRAFKTQRDLIRDEIEDVQFLLEKGLVERPRLRALQRNEAGLTGQIDSNRASIAQANQRINETRLQILEMEESESERIKEELSATQERIGELTEEINAAGDVVERLTITAPQDGFIVDMQFHTIGGVVQPGQRIADLVPIEDELIITARVQPQNIDSVYPGLPAEVILSALNQRTTPKLEGSVKTVSADTLQDERSGQPYYKTTVSIPAKQLERLPEGATLVPGMPAEVVIITGRRTAWNYFIQPLEEAAQRGLVAE